MLTPGRYCDWLLNATNTREEEERIARKGAAVPVPHPCSKLVTPDMLEGGASLHEKYDQLLNSVQKHMYRLNGYYKGKNGKCRFGYPFPIGAHTTLSFERTEHTVRAKVKLRRNDAYMFIDHCIM